MIKPGLLIWMFRGNDAFFIKFFHLIGFGFQKIDDDTLGGRMLIIEIHKLQLGIHLGKRRGNHVERIENEKSPTASA